MSSEISIRVEGLSKAYRIYPTPTDRLRQAVMPRLRRLIAPLLRAMGRPIDPPPYFSEFWALRELSFEVAKGETVGIIGRNGSGKSTLLQLICGTLTPSHGQVSVQGRVAALLELGSGFNPEYTGRENVFLNASVLGLTREETIERLDDILAFADIGEFIDQPVKTYSSGMAMRLAFAVVAHVDADVLIVDEALAVGDAYFQQKCFRWLRGFQKRGTVLFCGHDPGAVISLCSRAIWLDRGVVRMIGPAKQVTDAYGLFVHAAAIGLPETSVNLTSSPEAAEAEAEPSSAEPQASATSADEAFPQGQLEGSGFGSGLAKVTNVTLTNTAGQRLGIVPGGQDVVLTIRARADIAMDSVIIGFQLKDRLGQMIFVDNSYARFAATPVAVEAGQSVRADFRFRMPAFSSGEYSLAATIASGTQDEHMIHHFVHEALMVRVVTPELLGGIFMLPLDDVKLAVEKG